MLSPHTEDPRRKEALKEKDRNPAGFGYHGERRLPAMVAVQGGEPAAAPAKGGGKGANEVKVAKEAAAAAEAKVAALEDQTAVVIAAQQMIAAGEDFGKDGKPDVKRVEELTGRKMTAAARDAAWDAVKGQLAIPEPEAAKK